jgi:hypothetical protein
LGREKNRLGSRGGNLSLWGPERFFSSRQERQMHLRIIRKSPIFLFSSELRIDLSIFPDEPFLFIFFVDYR